MFCSEACWWNYLRQSSQVWLQDSCQRVKSTSFLVALRWWFGFEPLVLVEVAEAKEGRFLQYPNRETKLPIRGTLTFVGGSRIACDGITVK